MKKLLGGIYAIFVKDVGVYYGESNNIARRWARHRKMLVSGKHHNIKLRRAYKYFGPSVFTFVILEQSEELETNKELRLYKENILIQADPLCLNIKMNISDSVTEYALPNRDIYKNRESIYLERIHRKDMVNIRECKNGKLLGVEYIEDTFRLGLFYTDSNCCLFRKRK